MAEHTVGVLHPGQMGATVGAALAAGGQRVLWASAGRSAATQRRADDAGLTDAGTLAQLVADSAIIVSVCPPAAAEAVAGTIADLGFNGCYVDANAVSPATARRIAAVITRRGAAFVDAGIIGPPAREPGTTRMYVCGERAADIVAACAGSALAVHLVEGGAGSASALKMTYAAYTKGTTALLAAIEAVAQREGVLDALLKEWERSQPDLLARASRSMPRAALKAWRFVGEMEEIAATFDEAGLPPGFHLAAADVYRRLAGFKDGGLPDPVDVIDALAQPGAGAATVIDPSA